MSQKERSNATIRLLAASVQQVTKSLEACLRKLLSRNGEASVGYIQSQMGGSVQSTITILPKGE